MYDREVDNVLEFPGRRYRGLSYYPLYDRPTKKAKWLHMRKMSRLWSRFNHDPDDVQEPPWQVFTYWAWSSELKKVEQQLPFRERVAKFKSEKRYKE